MQQRLDKFGPSPAIKVCLFRHSCQRCAWSQLLPKTAFRPCLVLAIISRSLSSCDIHKLILAIQTLQVSPNFPIPLNAVIVSFLCGVVISLINLGSSVALNAIVSLTLSALLASYILSIGCILSKRLRGEPLPPSRWSLGRAGTAVNAIALVFLVPYFIFCFFPTATPVEAETMNWNIVMFGGIFLWATAFYVVKGRKVYIPPVRIVKRDI